MNPKVIVFASGTATGGGTGARNLVAHTRDAKRGELDAEIVALVSNHAQGGVSQLARQTGIPFVHFAAPWTAEAYAGIVRESGAEWVALSGWLQRACGLDPARTFNIHPALLSQSNGLFGGSGMYGHNVHREVAEALARREITGSGFSMHFVTEAYDAGPVFCEYRVPLAPGMSAEEIAKAVNDAEHKMQPRITNMVVHGAIHWDGRDPHSLTVPCDYRYLPRR